nr:ATP-binding protein [Corallococcus exercitus]
MESRSFTKSESDLYTALGKCLKATAILRFEPRKLAESSYSESPVPEVASDGTGLASTLAYLKLSHDEVFSEIELALKRVIPSVRRIRIERAAITQTVLRTIALEEQKTQVSEQRVLWGNRVVLDMQGAKEVPADSAGEGTLMVLGLLTVLMGPQKPGLVLLDDIELSLHPTAQGKLIEVLRAIQKEKPELQIVATSHSPFILNYLKPEEIRMTFLAENGFARCEKLTAHPEFEKWKDLMSPGEFWSTVGESWIGKVPASAPHE